MKNRLVYLIALLLIAAAGALISTKVLYGEKRVLQEYNPRLWRVNIIMNMLGEGGRAKVRLTLPKDNDRQAIYNEHFENNEMVFYVRERAKTGNRIGFWRSDLLEGFKSIQYTFSAQLRARNVIFPQDTLIPSVYPGSVPPETLNPSKFIQSYSLEPHVKKILKKERRAAAATRKIYDFVRGSVKYKSEKGSKDAAETLKKLSADCGGQSRLFVALSRAAGIPSRVVGGLILSPGIKNTTHVWAENYIGNEWVPFDVTNDHFGEIPPFYLELYRGDYFLIKHVGMKKFKYTFIISEESIPPLDNPWSLYVLPVHFQELVKSLLLIPVGALIVAFFRTVVGVPTFGTFTPILLSLAFREISLSTGLAALFAITVLGGLLRKGLDHLKILVIPRLAVILTMVVISVLVFMVAGFHFQHNKMLYISLFPMVIMTWMIERFSVLETEDGTRTAILTALGSVLVSVVTYGVFSMPLLKKYIFAFPELLLVVMALLLILGRYTGMRVNELWRFRAFLGKKKTSA